MTVENYSLERVWLVDADDIMNHLMRMNPDDIYLRFGYRPAKEKIWSYITESFCDNNYWFAVKDGSIIVGTLHISIAGNTAEFAFTVDENYRGQKIGQLLFARGYQLVAEFKIDRIFLACLTKNIAMRTIAKKFGLSVMTYGSDAEASVNITYPVPISRINEVKMVMIDKSILGKQ